MISSLRGSRPPQRSITGSTTTGVSHQSNGSCYQQRPSLVSVSWPVTCCMAASSGNSRISSFPSRRFLTRWLSSTKTCRQGFRRVSAYYGRILGCRRGRQRNGCTGGDTVAHRTYDDTGSRLYENAASARGCVSGKSTSRHGSRSDRPGNVRDVARALWDESDTGPEDTTESGASR